MDLDLLIESPELKLEQRFLIFRHFLANVPLPLVKSGAGAMVQKEMFSRSWPLL